MGNQTSGEKNQLGLLKGQGYRIVEVRKNSPFDNKVEPFFDFIISVTSSNNQPLKQIINPENIIEAYAKENENVCIIFNVLSTKMRNVRKIEITPNSNWNGSKDLLGIQTRKQKFDEVFDSYSKISEIQSESPASKAGLKEGQYLIGCKNFQYDSIEQFLQIASEIYFNKQINQKSLDLVVYDLRTDQIKEINLNPARGWGGKGLFGCKFLEGYLNKFPSKFQEARQKALAQWQNYQNQQIQKVQVTASRGSSVAFNNSLQKAKMKKKDLKILNHLIQTQYSSFKSDFDRSVSEAKVNRKEFQKLKIQVGVLEESLSEIMRNLDRLNDDTIDI